MLRMNCAAFQKRLKKNYVIGKEYYVWKNKYKRTTSKVTKNIGQFRSMTRLFDDNTFYRMKCLGYKSLAVSMINE